VISLFVTSRSAVKAY
jgi:hypothetical protein